MTRRARLFLITAALACPLEAAADTQVAGAQAGVVRWLDKVSGETVDLTLRAGESAAQGRLSITLDECRYPVADPASNAYAHLTIRDRLQTSGPVFAGWMIADSPALSAMDSSRYDVWLLRCINA